MRKDFQGSHMDIQRATENKINFC